MITEKMAETISHFAMQNEQLQKKLDIAVKALREYADEENWSTATTEINTDYFVYECSMYGLQNNGFEEAQKALKEIDSFEKCDKSHFFPSKNVEG